MLNIDQEFKAKNITIYLSGWEDSTFRVGSNPEAETKSVSKASKAYDSKVEVCNIPILFEEIDGGVQPAGQYEYPVELEIPAWLPGSTMLSNVSD